MHTIQVLAKVSALERAGIEQAFSALQTSNRIAAELTFDNAPFQQARPEGPTPAGPLYLRPWDLLFLSPLPYALLSLCGTEAMAPAGVQNALSSLIEGARAAGTSAVVVFNLFRHVPGPLITRYFTDPMPTVAWIRTVNAALCQMMATGVRIVDVDTSLALRGAAALGTDWRLQGSHPDAVVACIAESVRATLGTIFPQAAHSPGRGATGCV